MAALGLFGCAPAPSGSVPTPSATSAGTTAASPSPTSSPLATIVVPQAAVVRHRADQVVEPLGGAIPTIRLLSPGVDAGEPTIGILADGRIAFQGWDRPPEKAPGTATIAIIDPSSGSSSVVLAPGSLPSHDPYLWVDPTTNRIFTSHLQVPGELDPTLFCVVTKFSDDAGATWSDSARRCQATPEDQPRIITGKPISSETKGYPNVVYLCFQDDEAERGHLCARSLDGGLTFDSPTAEAFPYDGRCNSSFGQPAIGPDGSLWLVTAGCRTARVAVSRDEARTWQVLEVGGPDTNGEGESGVAVDGDGVVYVVWTAVDRLPRLVVSRDRGATWGAPMNVAAPDVKEANIATLAVGGPGNVAIGYVGSLDAPGGLQDPGSAACQFQPCPDLTGWAHATWHAWLTVTENALDASPLFTSAVLNDPASPIVRGNCGPGRCKALADFLDVAIDAAGQPMLAFVACPDGMCPPTSLRGAWATAPGVVGMLEGIDLR
ncbi:MAG: hypothetical protein ABI620_00440 [Chloroflexota bacterium]